MALTTEEEAQVRAIINAYANGQQIDDLPLATSAIDKQIEVFDTESGQSERMNLYDAVVESQQAFCGRAWNLDNATPLAATVLGSKDLLRNFAQEIGLGCYLVQNDHSRQKLDAKDHYRLATGEACKLDGTQGHYQWGWNRKWYIQIKTVNRILSVTFSLAPRKNMYNYEIPIASMSAAGHACYDSITSALASVVSEDVRYRGGSGSTVAEWDGTYRSQLGMPKTGMSSQSFLKAAQKNGDGWYGHLMRMHSTMSLLFYVIFGTTNIQAAFNSEKDADGLYQGGLGSGVTNISDWSGYNNYNPVIPTSAGIELGDACGVSTYNVMNENGAVRYAAPVPVFFGLKNPFGHLYRLMCDEQFQANADTSLMHLVLEKIHGDAWTLGNAAGFKAYSTTPAQGEGDVKTMSLDNLEMCPTSVGASSSTYWCDHFYNTSGVTEGFRLVARGGFANNGAHAGLACVHGSYAVSTATAYYGAALCEVAEEWSVEPKYAA